MVLVREDIDANTIVSEYLRAVVILSHDFNSLKVRWANDISGQSYKGSTIVNYNSRVIPDLKIPHIMTLGS